MSGKNSKKASRRQLRAVRTRSRRGVLLLVVLSMLVLFLMIGTAFIIVARQSEQSAKILNRAGHNASNIAAQGRLLDEVLLQLVRDTNNSASSLRFHSLLADMYGNDGWTSEIPPANMPLATLLNPQSPPYPSPVPQATAEFTVRWCDNGVPRTDTANWKANVTAGQILEFDLIRFEDFYQDLIPHLANEFSEIDDAYAGQVLTFLTGAARGASTRIVSSRHNGNWLTLRVLAFQQANGNKLPQPGSPDPEAPSVPPELRLQQLLTGSRILINGRPFNGTGAGLDPSIVDPAQPKLKMPESVSAVLDGSAVAMPQIALAPNSSFFGAAAGLKSATPYFVPYENIQDRYFFSPAELVKLNALYPDPADLRFAKSKLKGLIGMGGRGGSDESYDAPDFQNLPLAMIPNELNPPPSTPAVLPTRLVETVWPDDSLPTPDALEADFPQYHGAMVLPSFHRPELVNFWSGQAVLNPELLRKVLLRPSWFDHPQFTGSNPNLAQRSAEFALELANTNALDLTSNPTLLAKSKVLLGRMIFGPWDVDNDADGIRDSVWIDFGAPVMQGPGGKLVKPLVAVLCIDMDGRVNVNVASTLDMAAENGPDDWSITPFRNPPAYKQVADDRTRNPAGISTQGLPRGMGASPADVNLASAIDPPLWVNTKSYKASDYVKFGGDYFVALQANTNVQPPQAQNWLQVRGPIRALELGDTTLNQPGRYGADVRPGIVGFDLMNQIERFDMGDRVDQRSSFASPFDLNVRYAMGINQYGQPVFEANEVHSANATMAAASLRSETPGEFKFSVDGQRGVMATAADMPFSLAELERSLRLYDADSQKLPSRLHNLLRMDGNTENRLRVTTDSVDLPVPNVQTPAKWVNVIVQAGGRRPASVGELFEARVRYVLQKKPGNAGKFPSFPETITDLPARQQVRAVTRQLLAPELAAGLRLNLNRPLGNGRDDSAPGTPGYGVVDEPGEELVSLPAQQQRKVWQQSAQMSSGDFVNANFTPLDADGDGKITDADSWLQRQLLARHLYVTALLTAAAPEFGLPESAGGHPDEDRQLARNLAQWAANAVDFRDADNIMTGFEYDVNPFDGWDVDGWCTKKRPTLDPDSGRIVAYNGGDSVDNTAADRGLVWGTERPEMLITETFAWHDRRSEDKANEEPRNDENADGQITDEDDKGTTVDGKDSDFDQSRRPRGACFVELYNPWPQSPSANADTHDVITVPGTDLGVNISAVSADPDGNGPIAASPVWRLAVVKLPVVAQPQSQRPTQVQRIFIDPDDPDADPTPAPNAGSDDESPVADIERSVYFTGYDANNPNTFGPIGYGDADGATYFNNAPSISQRVAPGQTPPIRSVRPGRYLVIGAGDNDGTGVFKAFLGDPVVPASYGDPDDPGAAESMYKFIRENQWRVELEPSQISNVARSPFRLVRGEQGRPGYKLAQTVPDDPTRNDPQLRLDDRTWMCDLAVITKAVDERAAQPRVVDRRFSISEPPNGYPDSMKEFGLGARWREPDPNSPDPEGKYVNNETGRALSIDTPLDDLLFNEKRVDYHLTQGFHQNFKQICLQRLANPLLPWNPDPERDAENKYNPALPVNPYMTIDASTVNLTVFNGRSDEEQSGIDNDGTPITSTNPQDAPPPGEVPTRGSPDTAYFSSLERGWDYQPDHRKNRLDLTNLWSPEDGGRRAISTQEIAAQPGRFKDTNSQIRQNFKMVPNFTMGYLNKSFDFGGGAFDNDPLFRIPNQPDEDLAQRAASTEADPQPFQWLTWNNRPFVSGNELLVVPQWRSSQMLRQYSTFVDEETEETWNRDLAPEPYRKDLESSSPYETLVSQKPDVPAQTGGPNQPAQPNGAQSDKAAFAHLQNFFFEGPGANPPPNNAQATVPISLYRLLDLVQTPSIFLGAQTWLNPNQFGRHLVGTPAASIVPKILSPTDARFDHQPPFNTMSTYREPGRVNLNTMFSPTYSALFHDDNDSASNVDTDEGFNRHPGPEWHDGDDQFVRSRRGYGSDTAPMFALAPNMPTFFTNPFRSPNSGDLVPEIPGGTLVRAGVEGTLLRSTSATAGTLDENPLFAAETTEAANDSRRNAYFRYGPMIRLSNLTTTRSNIYAVWVTIGFFEVEDLKDNGPDYMQKILDRFAAKQGATLEEARENPLFSRVYPDGVLLGKEAGAEEGEQRRLRGFYIIDRTRPAGFKPGENINVENVIRLRRRIE